MGRVRAQIGREPPDANPRRFEWGWQWGKGTATKIDTTVQNKMRVMINVIRPQDEGWLTWYVRSISATKQWLTTRHVRSGLESLVLAKCGHVDPATGGLANRRTLRLLA